MMLLARFLFLIMISSSSLFAASKITVQIPIVYELDEIDVMINIEHPAKEKVEESSFTMQGKPLEIKKMPALPETAGAQIVESKYHFIMPGKPKGLYLLPSLRVKVGGNYISSPAASYEVIVPQTSEDLQLDARIVEKPPIYPGQKVTLQYLITFAREMVLTREKLPLLNFPKFHNIGEPQIENRNYGSTTVKIMTQIAKAPELAGAYFSGPSQIEGYFYSEDTSGRKVYSQYLVQARASTVKVTVLPFPEQGKPASFRGAIGHFRIRVKPKGPTNVTVGEKIELEVNVRGTGDFDVENLPDLGPQKGFGDDFHISEPLFVGLNKDGSSSFLLGLRPFVVGLTAIPPIEFSFFDPISGSYKTITTDPIQISVLPREKSGPEPPNLEGMPPLRWPRVIKENLKLNESEIVASPHARVGYIVLTAIILALLYFAQKQLRKYLKDQL